MNFKNIFSRKNRILLGELVRTDFKIRYQASFLGYVWSILNPLLLFAVLYLVFANFLGVGRDIEHFPVYLLLGVVLWSFFTETTNGGLKSIVSRASLIRKISLPKYIIVISGTVSSLINLLINLAVVVVFMVFNGVEFTWQALLIFPFIIQLYILALGISFLLSALNVKMRDIGYVWEILLRAGFYATPILYPLSMVVERSEIAAQMLVINPVAQVIQDIRYFVITEDSLTAWQIFDGDYRVFISYAVVLIILFAGAFYFKKTSGNFAENV